MSNPQTRAGWPRNPALDQAILAAAARRLGESGSARMSLESVAAAAGTTVPSLRRRYRNKAELAAAVIGSLRVEEPPASAPTPRAHALAILENSHANLRAIPALAILGSMLAEAPPRRPATTIRDRDRRSGTRDTRKPADSDQLEQHPVVGRVAFAETP
jgi:AcrR family transcriptional regulator